jgi:GNAT superfamily N-acetyltransferase
LPVGSRKWNRRHGELEDRRVQIDDYVPIRNAIHPETRISIEAHFAGTRQDDRADFLAYLDDKPVGRATGRRHFENRDSPVAFVSLRVLQEARGRGVRRHWRGLGLGRALKATQIDAAQSAGLRELRMQYESVNVPMRRICERLGYRPLRTWLHSTGPLLL